VRAHCGGDDMRAHSIRYIHRLSNFRIKNQIGEQVRAFVTGFRTLIAAPRLALFSTGELQMPIAGATDDLDLDDLRRQN